MLTWIAAHTTRIRVASRVLAVPFRRPAMVAKLAASPDQLSGGRLILGLGGGYADSEIAAVGAPELSPAAKITGLAEAAEILRGAWSQAGFSLTVTQYRVSDLEMQPRPAWPVPVCPGTFGPRALAVTGRLADGWIRRWAMCRPSAFPHCASASTPRPRRPVGGRRRSAAFSTWVSAWIRRPGRRRTWSPGQSLRC